MVAEVQRGAWWEALPFGAALMALGCGPSVGSGAGTPSSGSTGIESEGATTLPGASVTTAMGEETTTGALDSGVIDTGESWLDLPQSCSTIEQDCPPGSKCMPWASDGGVVWNDTTCVPIAPEPNASGEGCTVEGSGTSGIDDCDGASMCWDIDPETNEGTCVPFCIGTEAEPTCADPCDHCTIANDGVITLCFDACDPVAQDCPRGQACFPIGEGFSCAPDASDPPLYAGDPCEYINSCQAGHACVPPGLVPGCTGMVGCCTPFCGVGGEDPCPDLLPGSVCTPWFEDGQGPPALCASALAGVCAIP